MMYFAMIVILCFGIMISRFVVVIVRFAYGQYKKGCDASTRTKYVMKKIASGEKNFLCRPIFKRKKGGWYEGCSRLSTDDIDRVFNLYDVDRNGYIENEELHGFLKDLMEVVEDDYDADDLLVCQKILLDKCDLNHDGKINKEELTMVLTSCNKNNTGDDPTLP
ncbi:calbindin-32-like [Mercenaria mercenaria]|uniref:calbindin-32-like n=1 Tax=Mercenaria mercenaria TaxID=6596 RepID=UPI00234F02BF|nr:calbindin-32-like [Mercenaria mercenaria]